LLAASISSFGLDAWPDWSKKIALMMGRGSTPSR